MMNNEIHFNKKKRWYTLDEVRQFTENDWLLIYAMHNIVNWNNMNTYEHVVHISYMSIVKGYTVCVPKLMRGKLVIGLYGPNSMMPSYLHPEVDINSLIAKVANDRCIGNTIRLTFHHDFRQEDTILR